MGTGYQAKQAHGTRSKSNRPDKCRHTVTMLSTLFDAIRAAALGNNRSISEEMVARLTASLNRDADAVAVADAMRDAAESTGPIEAMAGAIYSGLEHANPTAYLSPDRLTAIDGKFDLLAVAAFVLQATRQSGG